MASSQNQGLKVALIISISLVFICLVTTFLGFKDVGALTQEREAAKSDLVEANKVRKTLETQINDIATNVGYPEIVDRGSQADAPGANTLIGTMKKEIATHAGQADKTYKGALGFLDQHIKEQAGTIEKLQLQNRQLTDALENRTAVTAAQIREADAARDAAQADKNKFIGDFTAENEEQRKEIQKLRDESKAISDEREQLRHDIDDQRKQFADQMGKMQTRIEGLVARVRELEFVDLEKPDGQIRAVDRRIKSVYISLGKKDFLPEQISFSVYPHDARTVGTDKPKAKIEVIRILQDEDHLAEARITQEELYDPIEPGDLIYNPGWNPGRQIRFALAGRYYINEDNQSDRDIIKSLIREFNGAVYDEANPLDGTCEVVEGSGQILGEVNHLTSYLVLGDPPKLSDRASEGEAGQIQAEVTAYESVLNQAHQFGVRVIPYRQFLEIVGYTSQQRLYQAGSERPYTLKHGARSASVQKLDTYDRFSPGRVSALYQPGFEAIMLPHSRTKVSGLYMQGREIRSSRGRVSQAAEGATVIEQEQPADAGSVQEGAPSGNGTATKQP